MRCVPACCALRRTGNERRNQGGLVVVGCGWCAENNEAASPRLLRPTLACLRQPRMGHPESSEMVGWATRLVACRPVGRVTFGSWGICGLSPHFPNGSSGSPRRKRLVNVPSVSHFRKSRVQSRAHGNGARHRRKNGSREDYALDQPIENVGLAQS